MKLKSVSISSYGNYKSTNYGLNAQRITIGDKITVYFSYKTPVAFEHFGELVCRENDWGKTTGKHLNWIQPDKSKRVSGEIFEELLDKRLTYRERIPAS